MAHWMEHTFAQSSITECFKDTRYAKTLIFVEDFLHLETVFASLLGITEIIEEILNPASRRVTCRLVKVFAHV